MKVKITADSTCDLPADIVENYDIGIAPLYIIMDEKPYKDRLEISANDIFEYVDSGKGTTHSNAINISEYQEYFSEWLKDCDEIVHISIGNHYSACHQNAKIAAAEVGNVYVVDSQSISTGSGHVVLNAAIMAHKGMEAKEIVQELELLIPNVEASFVLSNLKYMHLGGRCSGITALGANLLKLNPRIDVVSGKMEVGKKFRGAFEKVILQYVVEKLTGRNDIDPERIFVTYSPGTSAGLVDKVVEKVKSLHGFNEIIHNEAGCVISNHCGPNCLGILFIRK